ncbi:MAG: hypothetical protein AAF192_00475 [Pseudomonadota bacterium]
MTSSKLEDARVLPRRPARAAEAWTRSYADPIQVAAGERVRFSGRIDIWDGCEWRWAAAADGREGWLPDWLCDADDRARIAYETGELSVAVGEIVQASPVQHGWRWCAGAAGEGWVPARLLEEI